MSPTSCLPQNTLLDLPAELMPMISSYLEYPDILSLRLVHPYFYYSPLLNTDNDAGIRSRVAWLCSVGSFGPLEVLLKPKAPSTLPFPLTLTRDISIWALVDPLRLSWRTEEISRVCMRLKTDSEFLSNVQIQRMLRLRVDHAGCVIGTGCRVVPGTTCSGPKEGSGRLQSTPSYSHILRTVRNSLNSLNQRLRGNKVCSGWDMLFLTLMSMTLVISCSLLVQKMACLLGRDIGLPTIGCLVMGIGMLLVKS